MLFSLLPVPRVSCQARLGNIGRKELAEITSLSCSHCVGLIHDRNIILLRMVWCPVSVFPLYLEVMVPIIVFAFHIKWLVNSYISVTAWTRAGNITPYTLAPHIPVPLSSSTSSTPRVSHSCCIPSYLTIVACKSEVSSCIPWMLLR